jgi:Leucine-rich repeat (LRR) protein
LNKNLKYLDISHNQITSLHDLILPNGLIYFLCSNNQIRRFEILIPEYLTFLGIRNNFLSEEYYDDNGYLKSRIEINEITYRWRFNRGLDIINETIRDKKARDIQRVWRDYWLKPTKIKGYDYPVSRYMISHKGKF